MTGISEVMEDMVWNIYIQQWNIYQGIYKDIYVPIYIGHKYSCIYKELYVSVYIRI